MNRTQIVWSVVFCIVLVILYLGKIYKSRIFENKEFTTGKISFVDYKASYKGTNFIYFDCTINGVIYKERFSFPNKMSKKSDTLIGIIFPVLYDKTNFKHIEPLLYQNQYRDFNLVQPDSLKWVNKYFDK